MTIEQAYQVVTDLDEFKGFYFHRTDFSDSKPSFSRPLPAPSKPASSPSSIKPAAPSGVKPTTPERRTVSEPEKVNPRTQCYRCQGYGHLASQCPSQTKTLFVKISIEDIEEEDDGEVAIHQQEDDSDASVEKYEFNGCIRTVEVTNLSRSIGRAQLGVVRCT